MMFGKSKSEKEQSEKVVKSSSSPVTYGGFKGNALLYAIVATATCGFSLFG